MASLLSWLGNGVKRIENTVNNDVVAPVQRAVAQVNPLDNGRTWSNPAGNAPQQAAQNVQAPSAIQQLMHNGVTNFVGNGVVKPLVRSSMALNQGIGNLELKLAGRPTQNAQQYAAGTNIPSLQRFSGYTGTKQQIAGDLLSNTANIAMPGSSKLVTGAFEHVLPVVPKIINRAVANAGVGAVGGAVNNVGGSMSANNIHSANDLLSAAKTGAQFGAALGAGGTLLAPLAKAGGRAIINNVNKAPQDTPAITALKAQKQASLKAMETAKPNMIAQHVANVNSIDSQIKQLQQSSPVKRLFTPLNEIGAVGKDVNGTGKPKLSSSGDQQPLSTPQLEAHSSSLSPTTFPQAILNDTTQKIDQQVQPGSGTVKPIQSVRQGLQRQREELARKQKTQLPTSSSNSTPMRGFIKSVKGSEEVSPTVAGKAAGTYKVRNTKNLADSSETLIKQQGLTKATEIVNGALDVAPGKITDTTVSNAIAVAKKLDSNNAHAQATGIYEKLAEHLTKQGQSIQAASILSNRTPEGLRYQIAKVFKKAGVTPSDKLNAQIDAKLKEVKATTTGTPERILATKQLQKLVADNIPSNVADKVIGFWKAGLLTGMRTQSGNLLSNETFSILHNVSNPIAAGLDRAASLVTKQRTKVLTGKGLLSGTIEGTKRGGTFLKTGIDERAALTNKFDAHQVNFKNKAINTYVNGVFKLMGAADRPHYYRQLQNSLYDLAKAEVKNQNIPKSKQAGFIADFVKNPPTDKFQLATSEAEKSVLAHDTMLNNIVQKIRSSADNAESPLGKAAANLIINVIAPFTKVPSAFLSRVVDFTPVGAIKTIATQISRKQFDQRALVTALSEATTGTAVMFLGSKLAEHGLLSGNYPSNPKEQQRWKAEGIQPNSIKVGDKWLNMNYMGPVGLLFAAGARAAGAKQHGDSWLQQQAQMYAGMPKDLTQQSFLQGLNNNLQAINDPGRYLNNAVKSQVASIVPTIVNDVATSSDQFQRQSNNPIQSIESRIPRLRQTLNPSQDVYGNKLPRKTGVISSLINPFRPTTDLTKNNPMLQEVNRLHNADPNNNDLQVTPTVIGKTVSLDGTKTKLTDQQRYKLQSEVGQVTQTAWTQLIQTPAYKALSDTEKANALTKLRQDAQALAKKQFSSDNSLGQWSPTYSGKPTALTASQIRLSQTGDASAYAIPKGVSMSQTLTPADKYNAAVAKYNTDSSTMTDVQKYAAQQSLAKMKVQAPFSSDVVSLYGMSKAAAYDYLTTHPDGKKLADQLVAYDKALYNSGQIKNQKYADGITQPQTTSVSRGTKTSTRNKAAVTKLAGVVKATRPAPIKVAQAPHFSVKPLGTIKYKQANLKQFAVKKATKPKVTKLA